MRFLTSKILYMLAVTVTLALPVALHAQQDHSAHSADQSHQHSSPQQGGMMNHEGGGGMMNHEGGMDGMMEHMQHMHAQMHAADTQSSGNVFNSIQQTVEQLRADPNTDWSQVDIPALQQHLVDMEMLSLFASVESQDITGEARFIVSGQGRVLEAIQRMVPMHAEQMNKESQWQFNTEVMANGVEFTVVSAIASDTVQIRALESWG